MSTSEKKNIYKKEAVFRIRIEDKKVSILKKKIVQR